MVLPQEVPREPQPARKLNRGRGGRRPRGPRGPDVAPRGVEQAAPEIVLEDFESAAAASLLGLRSALTDLLHSVGADPLRPQQIARTHRLNKNLTWKISRIVGAELIAEIAAHLPGPAALDILLEAMERAGAPPERCEAVRDAAVRLGDLIARHAGDRATLAVMLDELSPSPLRADRLEAARRSAFLGNSAIWGVQARARVICYALVPSREPGAPHDAGVVDIVRISALLGFRRLRGSVRWPLFQAVFYNDDGSPRSFRTVPIDPPQTVPVGASGDRAACPLIGSFCSTPMPVIEAVKTRTGLRFELPDGPVGTSHAIDVVLSDAIVAAASIHADERNRVGSHPIHLFTPTAALMCDLLIHRDLPLRMPPSVRLYSRLTADEGPPIESDRLPLLEQVQTLGAFPPAMATPLAPRHAELVAHVLGRRGLALEEFSGWRFAMRNPPIAAVLNVSYPLLEAR
ncbi:MAG TPA: hypothetical protein PKC43_04890 [Phycisphaerales bacterium]|nr:hypothetical protein [Phycisphaerales bacterium]HMP36765.1 hypothetical protein [Phycisphaerales bacterium]